MDPPATTPLPKPLSTPQELVIDTRLKRLDALIAAMGAATAEAIGGKKGSDLAKKFDELRALLLELYPADA